MGNVHRPPAQRRRLTAHCRAGKAARAEDWLRRDADDSDTDQRLRKGVCTALHVGGDPVPEAA
jgi:hypothetical protein